MKTKFNSIRSLMAILAISLISNSVVLAEQTTEKSFSSNAEQTFAQQKGVLTGTVVDKDGEPIIGATVILKGTTKGTYTDAMGNFSLEGVGANDVITVKFMGYITKEITGPQKNVTITLEDDAVAIDDVVVIGYGSQRKTDVTGGIAVVDAETLERTPGASLTSKLQGAIPGMNVTISSADPSSTATITVRGQNSLSASNDPLIILNGSPFSGSLNDIDPSSVENISVLKDASSAAIYGSRASNGVILITTKKGEKGRISISYNGYASLSSVERRLNLMEGEEWLQYMVDYSEGTGLSGDQLNYENILKTYVYDMYQQGIETDWQDEVFRTSLSQNHQVSISGGTDKSNYYLALSYLDDQGVLVGSQNERINVTTNIDQQIGTWLKVGLNAMYTRTDSGGTSPSLYNAIYLSPYGKNYDEDGNIVDYPLYAETLFTHPYSNINATIDDITHNTFLNGYLNITFCKGLTFNTSLGYNQSMNEYGSYYGRNTLSGSSTGGSAYIFNSSSWNYTWENVLKYENQWGKHKLDVTGLFSAQESTYQSSSMSGSMFVNDDNLYHQIEAAENSISVSSDHTASSMLSWMGRINYGYDNRYLLTLTMRSDGYSAFGENNKWAIFPSVAGAWVISNEGFFSSVDPAAVSLLKLRLSYGGNGNQGVSSYQTIDSYTTKQYVYGDGENTANAIILGMSDVGNPNLKWETTYTFNAGVDFGFLNNRLSGSIDFYKSTTSDLLMYRTVPVMNGYTSIWDNVGKTSNTGFELSLNSINIQNKDFTWTTNVNYSYNNDKILELTEGEVDDVTNSWFIGQNLRVIYDYVVDGVWQSTDDIANSHQPTASAGDSRLVDTDGNGELTSDDRQIIGSTVPKHIASMTNTFSYKNFTLSFMLNGAFDYVKTDPFINIQRFVPEKGSNYISGINYWTPTNASNDAPSPSYTRVNDHNYYMDASYLRISDATFRYDFGESVTKALSLKALAVYVSGKNLYTFTSDANMGYNVEASSGESYLYAYPTSRQFILGLNITF